MKKLRTFKTILANGFQGVWRNKGVGFVSTATIFAVMMLVGVLLLAVLNVNGLVNTINETLDKVVVYLRDETNEGETQVLLDELSKRSDVELLRYVSKDQAIIEAKNMFSEDNFILSGLEKNPFPASIVIELVNINEADSLVNFLKSDKRIEEIRYHKDLIDRFIKIDSAVKIGGFITFAVIILVSIFIISNIIKIAISSRKEEIEIMKYVGASESFIKGPFVIEGLFYAVLGSTIAFVAISYAYRSFTEIYANEIYEYISFELLNIKDIFLDVGIIYLAIGIGIGSIGSLMSIRKYLKV